MDDGFEIQTYLDNPVQGLRSVCSEILEACYQVQNMDFDKGLYRRIVDKLGLFLAINEALDVKFKIPRLTGDVEADTNSISKQMAELVQHFDEQLAQMELQEAQEKYRVLLGRAFTYELSEGDLSKIQQLLNELRDRISTAEILDDKHKDRLLKKLEVLQAELHKKMTSLDKFWGLAGEGAVLVQKYGEAAKPFLEVIKVILRIIWATQGRAEELPSNAPNVLIRTDDQEIA